MYHLLNYSYALHCLAADLLEEQIQTRKCQIREYWVLAAVSPYACTHFALAHNASPLTCCLLVVPCLHTYLCTLVSCWCCIHCGQHLTACCKLMLTLLTNASCGPQLMICGCRLQGPRYLGGYPWSYPLVNGQHPTMGAIYVRNPLSCGSGAAANRLIHCLSIMRRGDCRV